MNTQIINCPECGHPAEVIGRMTLPSTDGPIEHTKVRCLATGRWFFTIAAAQESAPERPATAIPAAQRRAA